MMSVEAAGQERERCGKAELAAGSGVEEAGEGRGGGHEVRVRRSMLRGKRLDPTTAATEVPVERPPDGTGETCLIARKP